MAFLFSLLITHTALALFITTQSMAACSEENTVQLCVVVYYIFWG